MKRIIVLLCCFPLFNLVHGQNLRLTLEEAINYALQKNYSQQSLSIDRQIEQTVLDQSKLELLPDLKANLSHGLSNTPEPGNSWNGNYALSASLSLFEGGKNMNAIKLNKLSLSQADSKIAQAQNTLASDVIQLFLEVIMNEELYSYLQVVEKTSTEQMLQGEIKYKNGKILESDYLLLKAQASTDHYNVVNTQVSRDNSMLRLKSLLSMNENEPLEIVTPDLDRLTTGDSLPSVTEVISRTFEWFPDLQIARLDQEISSLNIKQAQSAYYPTLSLGGSIGSNYLSGGSNYGRQLGDKFNQQVSITLSVPLWDKGRTRSQVRQSAYRLEQSKLSRANTELQLRHQLEQEYNTVKANLQKYQASSERAEAYKESAAAYRVQFQLGQITVVDMLQQETNYLSALNDCIQNKYTYLLNRKLIDVYMGVKIEL